MLTTPRLLPRQRRDDDLDDWAALNADPAVREFFGWRADPQARASMNHFRDEPASRGWGWWAVGARESVAPGQRLRRAVAYLGQRRLTESVLCQRSLTSLKPS